MNKVGLPEFDEFDGNVKRNGDDVLVNDNGGAIEKMWV